MKIGAANDFFSLECCSDCDVPFYKIEAKVSGTRGSFYGSNDRVLFGLSDADRRAFADFFDFKLWEVYLPMTEGCSIHIRRHPRGNLTINYTISRWGVSSKTSLSGSVDVEGEFATEVINELQRALAE